MKEKDPRYAEFERDYGRPKKELPVEEMARLRAKGLSYREIADELRRQGYAVSKSTVGRRFKD